MVRRIRTPRRQPVKRLSRLAELAQLDALEALNWPTRIDRALENLHHARSPLRTTNYDTTSRGNDHDPGFSQEQRKATEDARQLNHAVLERAKLARVIQRIIDESAPLPIKGGMGDTENAALWCENHLKYNQREPRSPDGSRNCNWCRDVHRNFGKWPTEQLIRLHHEGRRIDETTYRRLLGKNPAA